MDTENTKRPTVAELTEQAERMAMRGAFLTEDCANGKMPTGPYAMGDARDAFQATSALMAVANGRIAAEMLEQLTKIAESLEILASVGVASKLCVAEPVAIDQHKAWLLGKESAPPNA